MTAFQLRALNGKILFGPLVSIIIEVPQVSSLQQNFADFGEEDYFDANDNISHKQN
jgi:hypothetical protein